MNGLEAFAVVGASSDHSVIHPRFDDFRKQFWWKIVFLRPLSSSTTKLRAHTAGMQVPKQPQSRSIAVHEDGHSWEHIVTQHSLNLRVGYRLPLVGPRASVKGRDGRSAS